MASNKESARIPSAIYTYIAVLLLGILFAQTITSIPQLSITWDEDHHITSGYSILRTGDLRLIFEHPPMIKLWMSWPLLLSPQIPKPQEIPGWAQGDLTAFARNKIWRSLPIDSWLIPCRITIPWLAVLLGAFLFRWASDWFGRRAGLLALALLTFDPNILAHATVATVDLGVTCFIFIAMYMLQRFIRRPDGVNLVLAGIALGLALAAKISALVLLPVSGGLMLLWGVARRQKRWAAQIPAYMGIAFLTLWAVNLFEFGKPRGFPFAVPAPSYWRAFLQAAQHSLQGNLTYLLGEIYVGGRWYFFPVVFALKTPLPALILLGTALLVAWRRPQSMWRELVLASLPVSYLAVSLFSSINLGYRHLLPIMPFVYLFIARLAGPLASCQFSPSRILGLPAGGLWRRQWLTILILAFLLWQAVGTLRTWPFYLTFFNEVAGGSRNGYRYLADSNVDWGQGLKAVRTYLEAHHWINPRLSIFTPFIRPDLYGIQAVELPPSPRVPGVLPARFNPEPGIYVISASTLRGLQVVDYEMYNWFWHREPDDIVANAMLVYQVHERTPTPTWLAQCTVPVIPLEPEQVAEGFGRTDLRLVYFDCVTSWLYPTGGKSPGWVALAHDTPVWATRWLKTARLSYEQKQVAFSPPFRIYEDDGHATFPQGGRVRVSPSTTTLAAALDAPPVDLPVTFAGGLTLLGYALDQSTLKPGETVHLETAWRVDSVPGRLLSVMAHVLDSGGRWVAGGDGLGVPIENWQPGDVFVQRHTLTLPNNVSPGSYWVQTGVYWLDNGERWPVRDARAAGDRALLIVLSVQK